MDDLETLCFEAGPLGFCIEAPRDLRSEIVAMFSGFQQLDSESPGLSLFAIGPVFEGGTTKWAVSGPNVAFAQPLSRSIAFDALIAGVNLSILDVDRTALHLHSAAVARGGRAVLVVGESGSGKTTLAATLSAAGWRYITDEMVRLIPGQVAISGFPKPLSIRASGADLVADSTGAVLSTSGPATSLQVSPSQLGVSVTDTATPCVLLLCSGSATERRGEMPTARETSHTDAVVALMGQTMDAERFGDRAVEVLSSLAARCRCYAFEVGEPAAMTKLIAELEAESRGHSPPCVELLPNSGRICDSVRAVQIGEEAVVHDVTSGFIAALDAPAVAIWRELAESPLPGLALDLDGPIESKFVSQLVSLGLVEAR